MAAMLTSCSALSATPCHKLALPLRSVAAQSAALRSFNANAQMLHFDDDDDPFIRSRRGGSSLAHLFPDRSNLDPFRLYGLDPFYPSRSLSQVLNQMDRMTDNPFQAMVRGTGGGLFRKGFNVREDDDGLHLRVDMPGLGKEDVQVYVEQNTLVIKAEEPEEEDDEASGRKYSTRIDLPPELFKMEEIKAEMKNGVLKIVVPKIEEREGKDVFHVKVE
ncbi:hypothetical protein ACLOJK_013445 [Asimina triloba]